MRLRTASIAFLLGALTTGIAWLSLQPVMIRLLDAARRGGWDALDAAHRMRAVLPLLLGLDMLIASTVTFAVLYLTVGRPLRRTEREIDQLSRLELELPLEGTGGPLVSRLQRALRRMAEALKLEQQVTARQLEELRAANERLGRAQAALVATERLATVGKLAAGVAHEIGNPLSGILGYLSVARAKSNGEVQDYLARIDREVQRIDSIVRELLDLGRAPGGTAGAVDVGQIAKACVELLGAGPDFVGVVLQLEFEPGTVARAESGALSQVLLNLLINAAHAVGGTGTVRVRGRRDGDHVLLDVVDTGRGISSEAMSRLFEPFFTTKPPGQGTGLGLAISHHLVSQMGGGLHAANSPTGGAVFTVTLPAA
jgi:two-component system NtrC family sensor kinase